MLHNIEHAINSLHVLCGDWKKEMKDATKMTGFSKGEELGIKYGGES